MKKSSVVSLGIASFFLLVLVVVSGMSLAPDFTKALIFTLALIIAFIFSENLPTHHAAEFENRFWTVIGSLVAYSCVSVKDSPFYFIFDKSPILAFLFVIVGGFSTHNLYRNLHRKSLLRTPSFRRSKSSENLPSSSEYVDRINFLLTELDGKWFSTSISILWTPIERKEEEILEIFRTCSKVELNTILTKVPVGHLFYKIKDKYFFWKYDNRSKLLSIIFDDRVNELSLLSKATVVDGLMRLKLTAHSKGEIYIRNIFMGIKEDQLSEFKSLIDSKMDFYNLHKLIFYDIRTKSIRKDIIDRILRCAKVHRSHNQIGSKNRGKKNNQYAWRKILSDIDDTFCSSGGSYPAGEDTSFPHHVYYPGVFAFLRELDLGTCGEDYWVNGRLGNVVFLSARPHVYKDMSETETYRKLSMLFCAEKLHAKPTLLAGDINSGGKYMLTDDPKHLAATKYKNFEEYMQLYPEFSFVFIGDNGQGDVRMAEMASKNKNMSCLIERSFFHDVSPVKGTQVEDKSFLSNPSICFFRNYIDAGIDALNNHLIRPSGLYRIVKEACADILEIQDPQIHSMSTKVGRGRRSNCGVGYIGGTLLELRIGEMNESIEKANQRLQQESEYFPPCPVLPVACRFPVGFPVYSKFGIGIVTKFYPLRNFYDVLLFWDFTGRHGPSFGSFHGTWLQEHRRVVEIFNTIDSSRKSRHSTPIDKRRRDETSNILSKSSQNRKNLGLLSVISTRRQNSEATIQSFMKQNVLKNRCSFALSDGLSIFSQFRRIQGLKVYCDSFCRKKLISYERNQGMLSRSKAETIEVKLLSSTVLESSSNVLCIGDHLDQSKTNSDGKDSVVNVNLDNCEMQSGIDCVVTEDKTSNKVYQDPEALLALNRSMSLSDLWNISMNNICGDPWTLICYHHRRWQQSDYKKEYSRLISIRGCLVWTRYGNAVVLGHREVDDMLMVAYQWKSIGFIRRLSAVIISEPGWNEWMLEETEKYCRENESFCASLRRPEESTPLSSKKWSFWSKKN